MDYEATLVTKAIQGDKLADVVARGIEPEHFLDEEVKEIYEWSMDFMRDHQRGPSLVALKREFPRFRPKLSKDPLSYHIEEFVQHVREVKAIELVRAYHDMIEDPDSVREIEVHALDMARQLTEVVPSPRATRLSDAKAHKEDYYRRKKAGLQMGIPLGFVTFDEITLGLQLWELLIYGGPPGGGKTTAQQYTSLQAYLAGKVVLFVSLEVEAQQILRKFFTMMAKVRAHALKKLDLNPEEEEKWTAVLERCEKERMEHDIIIRDDIRNCTPAKVGAEQIRYNPGLVVVDYLEEMRTPRGLAGWEGVAENGRELKQQARTTLTPHITATQLNRDGDTAYQSAQKIADMLIVIEPPDEDEEDSMDYVLRMRKYRDGPSRKAIDVHWDVEHGDIHERVNVDRFRRSRSLTSNSSNGNGDGKSANIGAVRAAKQNRPQGSLSAARRRIRT